VVHLIVILSKRSLRSEGSERAARSVAFFCDTMIARLDRFLTRLHYYLGFSGE